MKKLIAFFSILFSLFGYFSLITTYANSAPKKIYVPGSYGVINVDDNPIDVVKEDLTFDIFGTSASVTAEYTFHNDSNDDIVAELLFPIGYAANINENPYSYNPEVYINSTKLDTKMRLMPYNGDIIDSLYKLSDDYEKSVLDEYNIYYYEMKNDDNTSHTVSINGGYFISNYVQNYNDIKDIINGNYEYLNFRNYFFVLAKGEYNLTIDDGSIEYSVRESNKQEFARKLVNEKSNDFNKLYDYYDEVDVYNLFVLNYSVGKALAVIDYNIEISANSNCINKVKTNMQYYINTKYGSPVYQFKYYVSPASKFKSFKNLNVYLNTDMYIIKNNIKLAKQKDGSFKVSYNELINKEIELALSYDKSVKSKFNSVDIGKIISTLFALLAMLVIILPLLLLLILGIVALIIAKKKKKLKNNVFHCIGTISLYLASALSLISIYGDLFTKLILFVFILTIISLVLGIVQLIFDTKKYRYQAIIFDSVILALICITIGIELWALNLITIAAIMIILYLFNLAYLFFKPKFLKNKENIIDTQEELKIDNEITVESNEDENNDSKDNE